MPKLPSEVRKRVKKAEAGGFAPIPTGIYEADITSITTAQGAAGPYWKIEFTITSGKFKGRKQWLNCSFSEGSEFRLKELLEATGSDENTDSDDIEGSSVKLAVSEGKISSGPRKGEPSNDVDRVFAGDADTDEEEEDEDEDEPEDEDDDEPDDEEEEEEEKPKKKAPAKAKAGAAKKGKKKDDEDDDFNF